MKNIRCIAAFTAVILLLTHTACKPNDAPGNSGAPGDISVAHTTMYDIEALPGATQTPPVPQSFEAPSFSPIETESSTPSSNIHDQETRLTDGQMRVAAAGLDVEWIDPASAFGAVSYTYLGERDSEGYYVVTMILPDGSDKRTYINELGENVIPALYDLAFPFQYGVAEVMVDRRWTLIDTKGNELFELNNYNYVSILESGLIYVGVVTLDQEFEFRWAYGLLDRNGNEIFPPLLDQ